MLETVKTFAPGREHQHPPTAHRLADVRNPNAATVAREERKGWRWTDTWEIDKTLKLCGLRRNRNMRR
jgi:hypothetical protein